MIGCYYFVITYRKDCIGSGIGKNNPENKIIDGFRFRTLPKQNLKLINVSQNISREKSKV